MILYLLSPMLKAILDRPKVGKIFIGILVIASELIYIFNIYRGYNGKSIIKNTIPQTLRLWTWISYFFLGGIIRKSNTKLKISKSKK